MEPDSYELEMRYHPVAVAGMTADDEAAVPAPNPAPGPLTQESPLWYWVRSGFVITVGAGLVGIGAGLFMLLASWIMQERRRGKKKYLPDMKG